jgi:hypothetical protein
VTLDDLSKVFKVKTEETTLCLKSTEGKNFLNYTRSRFRTNDPNLKDHAESKSASNRLPDVRAKRHLSPTPLPGNFKEIEFNIPRSTGLKNERPE